MRKRLEALTGLRFVAAAMILVAHAPSLRIPVPPFEFANAVALFFVLSGFVLAHAYPQLDDLASIGRFLCLRVARIWPAHAFTLVVAAIVTTACLAQPFAAPQFLASLIMVHAWVPMWPWYFSFNAPSWSISTEFFFYLTFPPLIWRWRRTWWWKFLVTLALAFGLATLGAGLSPISPDPIITFHGLMYINPVAMLFEFVLGIMAYSIFSRLQTRSARVGIVVGTILEIVAFWLVACFFVDHLSYLWAGHLVDNANWRGFLGHTGSVLAFPILVIILALNRGVASRVLSTAPAILLGEISYSVYLVHWSVYTVYARYWMAPGNSPDYLGWIGCVCVAIGIAYLIWRFIEMPARTAVRNSLKRSGEKAYADGRVVLPA